MFPFFYYLDAFELGFVYVLFELSVEVVVSNLIFACTLLHVLNLFTRVCSYYVEGVVMLLNVCKFQYVLFNFSLFYSE